MIDILDFSKDISKVYVIGSINDDFAYLCSTLTINMSCAPIIKEHPLEQKWRETLYDEDAINDEIDEYFYNHDLDQEAELAELNTIHVQDEEDGQINLQDVLSYVNEDFHIEHEKREQPYDNAIFIVCGNSGIGSKPLEYYINNFKELNERLNEVNSHLFFLRGYYDNPSFFNEEKLNLSNIKTLSDYSIIKTLNSNYLCIGGGISFNRLWRKNRQQLTDRVKSSVNKTIYWEGEGVNTSFDVLEELKELNDKIDTIISFQSPFIINKKDQDGYNTEWVKFDENLLEDMNSEKEFLNNLSFIVSEKQGSKIQNWLFNNEYFNLSTIQDVLTLSITDKNIFNVEQEISMRRIRNKRNHENIQNIRFTTFSDIFHEYRNE